MTEAIIRTDMTVDLVKVAADDLDVVQAARVSTGKDLEEGGSASGLINFLMRNRHGTPFEHNYFKFRIEAPIFVWREFMRHRVGFSYNETSGRYTQLQPVFYLPALDRALVQQGKPGSYTFVQGTFDQVVETNKLLCRSYMVAWETYCELLDDNVAKEIARICLPGAIYSSAYVSCNARSMMSFLSLRTKHEGSMFPSFPQREIEMVAEQMERHFAQAMPITYAAFNQHGRVSP